VLVEMLNLRVKAARNPVELRQRYTDETPTKRRKKRTK